MKKILFLAALFLLSPLTTLHAQQKAFSSRGLTFRDPETNWVENVMSSLTLEQRVAQLMVVRVPLDMDERQTKEFSQKMNGYGVGGVCFFVGTADQQLKQTRRLQGDAKVPLLVCIDGEWGLGMRLKDQFSFPRAAEFGKLTPDMDSLVWLMGAEIGRQCREMGIHINFAPVVDINSNPKNPVIGTRSFGTDRERVAHLGTLYALGMQSQGVIAVAKHFPGHGDTDADSHLELPVINHTLAYIDSVDTYPFQRLIDAGVEGVMVAHLQVNALDPSCPSSLSAVVVDSLLRGRMGFKGLVITDGLDMKGVTNSYGLGTGELAALKAGNDILLLPPDVPQAIDAIASAALRDKNIARMVDDHCRRVLRAKYRFVVPHLKDDIDIPNAASQQVCRNIVEDLNININRRIDTIVERAIVERAMPGCQVVVLHKGRKVLDRTYGHLSYDEGSEPVTPETVYDLASLTKATATTLAIMKLVDDGKIKVDDKLSKYLPYLKDTDKESITVKEVMSHCAHLKAFDAYWQQSNDYDTILRLVAATPLLENTGMLYSDLGFMLLSDVVRQLSGKPLDQYVAESFYQPMGLTHTMFNPANSQQPIANSQIAPTELDSLRGLICGTVHDPNAYAMGGVSGHAGLFSTADEVAQLMQMLLDGGVYHGQRYLKKKTIDTFTSRHFEKQGNRRALGFDKQLLVPSANGQTAISASQSSYGHTGFTGTMVWVDPQYDLVYVFLSNRVHPSAETNKLAQLNVRTDIQQEIYKCLTK